MNPAVEGLVPIIRTNSLPNHEQPIGVILVFDILQFVIMSSEEGFLPVRIVAGSLERVQQLIRFSQGYMSLPHSSKLLSWELCSLISPCKSSAKRLLRQSRW